VIKGWSIRVFAAALVTYFALYGSYTIFASETFTFEKPGMGYGLVKLTYHTEMAEYFKDKVVSMLAMDMNDPNYKPPLDEKCPKENVSTYCVAMGALDRYMAYVRTLDRVQALLGPFDLEQHAGFVSDLPLVGGVTGLGETSVSQVFGLAAMRDSAVEGEKKNALSVMELTISAYNELKLAYPMHQKYVEFIDNLYAYRDAVKAVRQKAMLLPGKYVNATSKKGCD